MAIEIARNVWYNTIHGDALDLIAFIWCGLRAKRRLVNPSTNL